MKSLTNKKIQNLADTFNNNNMNDINEQANEIFSKTP